VTAIGAADISIDSVLHGLREHRLLPYIGPGMARLAGAAGPASYPALAAFLGQRVALPKRARGNAFAAAQYIESNRHRVTLDKLLCEAFAETARPSALHHFLAALRPPLIVDTWYDSAMRDALAPYGAWGEIQGISRGQPGECRWWRAYDANGAELDANSASACRTLLYKPHGGARPHGNFLLTDSDYVEVLTELDIQTPIPDMVKQRRAGRGFLFLGCRLDDQMLRAYARQVLKRSGGPHVAVLEAHQLTRNERRMLAEQNIAILDMALQDSAAALLSAAGREATGIVGIAPTPVGNVAPPYQPVATAGNAAEF
jgi:hypothetical protein